jgi:tRNA threonylcarbamoyl adenosine modification protein YjeE
MAYHSHNETETAALGARLAPHLRAGDCIALIGDLGTGKTALARGLVKAIVPDADVTSPTFSLVHPYTTADGFLLYHLDCYRLENPTECEALGIGEMLLHGAVLIEWPTIAESHLPQDRLTLTFTANPDDTRTITCTGSPDMLNRFHLT